VRDPPRWPLDTLLSIKVGTKFRQHVGVAQSVQFARGLKATEFAFTLCLGGLVSGHVPRASSLRPSVQLRAAYASGVLPIVLLSSRELPNKSDRTSRLLLPRLCPSLQYLLFPICLSATPFSDNFLSFIQPCLSRSLRLPAHNVIPNSAPYSPLCSPHISVIIPTPIVSTPPSFPPSFSKPLVSNYFLSLISLSCKSYSSPTSFPFPSPCCSLLHLHQAWIQAHSHVPAAILVRFRPATDLKHWIEGRVSCCARKRLR
jgi:hypothetical protein